MKEVAIIHFMPLENYPPVMNMINYLANQDGIHLSVHSTSPGSNGKRFNNPEVRITRVKLLQSGFHSIIRAISYQIFNLSTFLKILIDKPEVVFYYESSSALPVYIYLKFINKKTRLFIHYHEYFEKDWYNRAMKTIALNHTLELNYLYSRAEWISHTNHFRLEFFKKDNKLDSKILRILPNYPPMNWKSHPISKCDDGPIKFVLIGHTLNFDTMYGKEIIDWVVSQNGKVILDCYLFVFSEELEKYINNFNDELIKVKRNIFYYDIPEVIKNYSVGLILYKTPGMNAKFCASNKLFEYLACGLDVWFPNVMEGSKAYVYKDARPRVIDVDFEKLNQYHDVELFGESNLPEREINYTCETEYEKIYREIIREE